MNKAPFIFGFIALFVVASAIDCPSEDVGDEATYFPHETECGKFYECDHGSAQLLECPSGLYWDVHLNVCNRNVDCGNLATSTTPPVTTAPPPETTAADSFEED